LKWTFALITDSVVVGIDAVVETVAIEAGGGRDPSKAASGARGGIDPATHI